MAFFSQLGIRFEPIGLSNYRSMSQNEKKHPADFAVWKKSEMGWKSPWGMGFPNFTIS